MSIKVSGDFAALDQLREKANSINSERIPVVELLTDAFIKKYTSFPSFAEFADKSKLLIVDIDDVAAKSALDEFIVQNSIFSSFEEMWQKAAIDRVLNQLNL